LRPHLLHVPATFAPGGYQVRTARLINACGDAFRHTICALDGCLDALDLVDRPRLVETLAPPPRSGTAGAVRALRGLLRAARPDLLLTYNWGSIEAVMAGRTLGLAMLHHEDGFLPDEAAGFKRRRIWTRRLVLRWPRLVVVPSQRLHGIATDLWRLGEERVRLIPNGVSLETYALRDGNPELRAALGIPRDAFVVGSVGHLRPEKNPVRLVEAVARMRTGGVHLLLLGDGPERARVAEAARAAGLGARAHLPATWPTRAATTRAMDAFALSSDTEQMPVALVEAMACGLPAVSTDVGDVARMVPESGRAFVVALDAALLAEALDRLAAAPELRAALGAAGRARVASAYSFEAMVAAHRAAYATALGGPPA
jgi:glycosyltransferase involved in cell wall biosynthesis